MKKISPLDVVDSNQTLPGATSSGEQAIDNKQSTVASADSGLQSPVEDEHLDISIWITPDGQVFFHNICGEAIELAHALDPENEELAIRHQLLCKAAKEG